MRCGGKGGENALALTLPCTPISFPFHSRKLGANNEPS